MNEIDFDWKKIKLPTFAFIIYILLIPFESILAIPIVVNVSYATITAFITSLLILLYLLFKPKLVRLTKSAVPWIAYFIWAGFSIYWTIDRPLSNYNYIFISKHLFFFLLIGSYPFNPAEKRMIRHAVILSGVLLSATILFNTYQLGAATSFVRATLAHGYYKADPNHAASSILIPISFLIVDFIEAKKFKLLDALAIAILFATLIITGSRGGFFAFLAIVITFAVIYHHFKTKQKIIIGTTFVLASVGVAVFLYNPLILNRFAQVQNLDRYSANRIPVWKDSFTLVREKPFSGWGFGVYKVIPKELTQKIETAHNNFIQSLVEGGLISFILIIAAFIPALLFHTSDKFSRASKAGIVGILVTSMFLYTINYDYFWLAMILGEISNRTTKTNKNLHLGKMREIPSKAGLALHTH